MITPEKVDLGKQHKEDYVAPKKPVLLTIAPAVYLGIAGSGAPGSPAFTTRIGALYAMAYTVKMTRKFAGQQDYTIGKLESLYWTEPNGQDFDGVAKNAWQWQMLIRTPGFVIAAELASAASILMGKGKPPEVKQVGLTSIAEGPCVQMLHLGPYERIGETVAKLKTFAESKGLTFHGRHHEIYLSDPRRVPPEKLKTILREPVTKV